MAGITIHGVSQSRAARCIWLALELGIDWRHEAIGFRDGALKSPEFLAVNPNGAIPALTDDDFALSESLAINLYLAKKFGRDGFYPATLQGEALLWQWTLWAATSVEKPLLTILLNRAFLPLEQRDEAAAKAAEVDLRRPLAVLDRALVGRSYLLGDDFGIADLNVAAVLSWTTPGRVALDAAPNLAAWLKRCLGRPSFQSAIKDYNGPPAST
jgi:glutathione S-transferase